MQFEAVCFDLDGTLLDSLADLANCTNKILLKRGFPEHPQEAYRYFVGDGVKMLMTRVLPKEVRNEILIEECRQDFEKNYRDCWDEQTVPYENVPELLDELSRRKFKLTVLSNKPHEFTLIAVNKLLPSWDFKMILGQRDEVPRKPDPEGMLEICEKLKIPSSSFIYLGDTATDMQTSSAAGCFSVGVLWGFRNEEELRDNGAKAIVKDPLDVLDLLG